MINRSCDQQRIANAGYTVQSHVGIPDAVGFFSPPSLEPNQFAEGFQFLVFVGGVITFLEVEVRACLQRQKALEKLDAQESRNNRRGNLRYLAFVTITPYLVCVVVSLICPSRGSGESTEHFANRRRRQLRAAFVMGHPDWEKTG